MKLFLMCTFLFLAAKSYAAQGFKGGVGLTYLSDKSEGSSISNSELSVMEYNIKVGYLDGSVFYGAMLDSLTKEDGIAKATRSSNGLVIGYHGKAWFVDGIFFVTSEYVTTGGVKLKEGSGMGVDLGYNFLKDSTKYFLNGQISYKSFEYKKAGGVSASNKIPSEIYPMLAFGMNMAR